MTTNDVYLGSIHHAHLFARPLKRKSQHRYLRLSQRQRQLVVLPRFFADPETVSMDSVSLWDHRRGIMALHKYYVLRDEIEDMIAESRRV